MSAAVETPIELDPAAMARIGQACDTVAATALPVIWRRGDMSRAVRAFGELLLATVGAALDELGSAAETELPRTFRIAAFVVRARISRSPIPLHESELARLSELMDAAGKQFDPEDNGAFDSDFDPIKLHFLVSVRNEVGKHLLRARLASDQPADTWAEATVHSAPESLLERYRAFRKAHPEMRQKSILTALGLGRTTINAFERGRRVSSKVVFAIESLIGEHTRTFRTF